MVEILPDAPNVLLHSSEMSHGKVTKTLTAVFTLISCALFQFNSNVHSTYWNDSNSVTVETDGLF